MSYRARVALQVFVHAHVWQWSVYLALDEVIILVDLQDISRVARDGAAVSVVEVASGAAATQICIAD